MDISEFIVAHGLTMTCHRIDQNPNMIDPDPRMSHWACKIKTRLGKQLTVPFSMGAAHVGEPRLADVLDCMASDSCGVDNAASFEDWCGEYGYDTDSRKAERTFKICQRQSANLKRLLGDVGYQTLVYDVERV